MRMNLISRRRFLVNSLKNTAAVAAAAIAWQRAFGGRGDPAPTTEAPPPLAPLAPPDAEGFRPLSNGKDLTGWIGATKGYVAEDGMLVCPAKGGGNLYTDRQFADFHLKFEFKLTSGANNGLGIRMPMKGDAAYNAMEIQILDDSATQYANLKPYQFHGSIYGVVPCERGHQKPVGEWNTQEVIANGPKITVILNGATIVNADLDTIDPEKTLDGHSHPGLKNKTGHIGFLGHGSRVEFKNIRVKELTPASGTPPAGGNSTDLGQPNP